MPISVLNRNVWLTIAASACTAFGAEAPSTNAYVRMQFTTNSAGETLMRHGEAAPTRLKAGLNKVLNVTHAATNAAGGNFNLIPDNAMVVVGSDQFAGWSAEMPPKQSVSFGFDYPTGTLELATSDLNRDFVKLAFPDGASAEMDGAAQGRLEYMNDGTYVFYGAGSIRGLNADGGVVRFGNVFPPLFGGQLIAPRTNDLNGRFTRATPVVQLTFVGQIETGVMARVGDQTVTLETGLSRELTLKNGAQIAVAYNPQTRSIDWNVKRGVFRINVESFRCWKALATAGQAASMQWDTNGFLMELKNKNGKGAFTRTVLVNLNPSLNVAVGDSATFQYGRVGDCSTFVTSATGGETTLYNAVSGRFVRLDEGSMNIVSGTPDTIQVQASAGPKTPVRLAWSSDEKVEIKGENGTCTVGVDGEDVFDPAPGSNLSVSYAGRDKLSIRAEAGALAVTPEFMPNISIEISEGAAVTLGYDRGSEIFHVRPDPSNLSSVGVRTPTGFYPQIGAGSRLTFVVNRSAFNANGDGLMVFSETAGAGGANPVIGINTRTLPTGRGDAPLFGGANSGLDVSRIQQPPVTTLE